MAVTTRKGTRAARSPEAKAAQLAGLRNGRVRAVHEAVLETSDRKPLLTEAAAADFVKLLMAGVTPLDALRFLDPAYWAYCTPPLRRAWLLEVESSSFVVDATDRYNNGAWQDLEPSERLAIALDKHFAEMAYFLFTNNFADPSADRTKMTEARDALVSKLDAGDGTGGSAFDTLLKSLVNRADLAQPPTMGQAMPPAPVYSDREDH